MDSCYLRAHWECKLLQQFTVENSMEVSQKTKTKDRTIKLSYDPAIPLLGV